MYHFHTVNTEINLRLLSLLHTAQYYKSYKIIADHTVRHGSNKLGMRHQHALVVDKNSMINHTLAVVAFICAEKSGSGERSRDKSLR